MNIERLNLTFGLKCTKGVNDLSGDKKDLKLKGNLKKQTIVTSLPSHPLWVTLYVSGTNIAA